MGEEKDKKGINLMPEELRSKESGILSKVKSKGDFDFDFVSPKDSSLSKSKAYNSGTPFLEKVKKLFYKPKHFGQSVVSTHPSKESKEDSGERPKIIYNPHENKPEVDREESTIVKVGEKTEEPPIQNFVFNKSPKESILNEIKDIKAAPEEPAAKVEEKKHGTSLWDKLKAFFATKEKAPKMPKVERVPARPITSNDINKVTPDKTEELPDILDEKNIKSIPDILPPQEAPKTQLVDKVATQTAKVEEKQSADFSIPILDNASQKTDKEVSTEKKPLVQKFHQPQPRIRAKLLDNGGGVDLIPTSAKTRSWRQIVNLILAACLGAVLILAIFYGFLFYRAKNIEMANVNRSAQITSIERQIVEYSNLNKEITQLGKEIKFVHKLLSFHFYWTNFFQLLEKYTVADVYYDGLTAGSGGAITLHATATNFDILARQIKVLEQPESQEFVMSVDVSSAKYNESADNVEFDMTVVLNPSLFVYNENYLYEIKTASSTGDNNE